MGTGYSLQGPIECTQVTSTNVMVDLNINMLQPRGYRPVIRSGPMYAQFGQQNTNLIQQEITQIIQKADPDMANSCMSHGGRNMIGIVVVVFVILFIVAISVSETAGSSVGIVFWLLIVGFIIGILVFNHYQQQKWRQWRAKCIQELTTYTTTQLPPRFPGLVFSLMYPFEVWRYTSHRHHHRRHHGSWGYGRRRRQNLVALWAVLRISQGPLPATPGPVIASSLGSGQMQVVTQQQVVQQVVVPQGGVVQQQPQPVQYVQQAPVHQQQVVGGAGNYAGQPVASQPQGMAHFTQQQALGPAPVRYVVVQPQQQQGGAQPMGYAQAPPGYGQVPVQSVSADAPPPGYGEGNVTNQ